MHHPLRRLGLWLALVSSLVGAGWFATHRDAGVSVPHITPGPRPQVVSTPPPPPASVTRDEAHALVVDYVHARVAWAETSTSWFNPSRLDAVLAHEEGQAADLTRALAERIRRNGPTRTAVGRVYKFSLPRGIDIFLPPPGSGEGWFLAAVTETPASLGTEPGPYHRVKYLWFRRGDDGRWRTPWWIVTGGWKTDLEIPPMAVGPDRSWTRPLDPAALMADPVTICRNVAAAQSTTDPSWDDTVAWGPRAKAFRTRLQSIWSDDHFGKYVEGGSHGDSAVTSPGPVGPSWQLADGSVIVPCAVTYTQTMRATPGRTLPIFDSGFEQSIDARTHGITRWSSWEADYVFRSLVVIPPRSSGRPVDYVMRESWGLEASGMRVG